MKIEIGGVGCLFPSVDVKQVEMHGVFGACCGSEHRDGCQIAKQPGCLLATVVGDAADAAGGHDEHELVFCQPESGQYTMAGHHESSRVAATEPIQADSRAIRDANPADELLGRTAEALLFGTAG